MHNSCRFSSALSAAFSLITLSVAFSLPVARTAMAQPDRGTIYGKVVDQRGAALPEAKIELISVDAGFKSEAASDKEGLYQISNIVPGGYRILISRKGFKTAEKKSIAVRVAGSVRLDVSLAAGPSDEVVEVVSEQAAFSSEGLALSTLILSDAIGNLPLTILTGRHIEDFAYLLSPAVEGEPWVSHIAGAPSFTKEVLIDGLSATSQIQGNVDESSPTMESIQEFRVQTGAMSAEYGHAGGGLFNFSLRRGTNDLHGSAYYYGRNEALNANSWMNNLQLARDANNSAYQRARDRQSIAGLSAGGPIAVPGVYDGRNRSFLFGTFERYAQQDNKIGSYDRTVPIPAFLDGDFSSLLTSDVLGTMPGHPGQTLYAGQIFDPKTLRMENGQWIADPFPGNRIPQWRMSAVSRQIIDIYKKYYPPEIPDRITNNSAGPANKSPWFHQSQLTLRGDHLVSSKIKLSGSLIWTERPRILLDQGGIWDSSAAQGAGGPLARSRNQNVTSRSLRLSADWTANPTMIATASFAYNRYRNSSLSTQADGNWNDSLGLHNSTSAGLFPQISFGPAVNGNSTTDIGYGSSGYSIADNYIASGALYLTRGRHNIKMGGEFWAQQMNSHEGQDVLSFSFSQPQTGIPGQPWSNRVGFGFASFFLGEAESGTKNVPFDLYGRRKYVALYFQDDYRVSDSLTFNLGLRWEQTQPYHEKSGSWANFNPSLLNTKYDLKGALEFAQNSGDSFEKQKDWKEFSPRIGAAYQVGKKAVIRAGYGLAYIPLGMNYWSGVPYGFAPGYRGVNAHAKSPTTPLFNWDNGYPDNYKAPGRDPNALVWGMAAVDERSLFAGYVHQYNFSAQFDLGKETVVEAAFLGNQGRRLHNGAFKRNQPLRSAYENASVDPFAWIYDEASAAAAGVKYPYAGFSNYAGVALQPFPHVAAETGGSIYFVGSPAGSSSYRSFQLSLTRKGLRGLSFQLSYNASKAMGNSENGFDESWDSYAGIQDVNNLSEAAQTVVSFDQTHVFKGQASYVLPFGKGRRFFGSSSSLLNSIISGWEISCLLRYNSGNPLAVTPDAWRPGWEGTIYADFNPNVDLSRQFEASRFNPGVTNDPANRYFNASAFSNPKGSALGNGKGYYSELRGFGYAKEDIGIMKRFPVREGATVQLRVEMLNAFNRHRFADPNTDMRDPASFGNVTKLDANFSPRITQFGLRLDW